YYSNILFLFFFFNYSPSTFIYTLSLHDALPISDVNSDPFATEYFLKVQEAYNFLIDTNKRLLLHQFLQSNPNPKRQTARSSNYQQPNNNQPRRETSYQTSSKEIKPFIHFFSADKKVFRVN